MIKPIQADIRQGTSRAHVNIEPNSIVIKFNSKDPDFQAEVAKAVDRFVWSDEEFGPESLKPFSIDTFERGTEKNEE